MVKVELRPPGRERWVVVLGLAALMAIVGLLLTLRGSLEPPRGPRQNNAPAAAASAAERPPKRAARKAPPSPAEATAPAPGDAAEGESESFVPAPEEQAPAGQEPGGIGAFPAPGTKPIKQGIVVPDDFPLPPGYVRHFQATDNGRMLQAILMFHPDYQPLDASGKPIPVPPDRVVPPEMAPSGLPVELLEVPEDAYARPEEGASGASP